jgi:hypothetical protein
VIFISIGLGDQLVRHVSPVHHTNQNQTANNAAADTQVMISRRSSSDISRGPMLQPRQRATDRGLDLSSETLSVRPRPCLKMFIALPHSRPLRTCGVSRVIFALHPSRTNLFERSDPRFRSGQTREQIPSNAWARKIAAPTKPITAVIASNIANVPLRYCATENGGHLAQSKRFPGTNTQSRSPRIMSNRRASSCDPAPRIWDFAPRRAAERMLLDDDDNRSAVDDLRQSRELALLICRSEEAIGTFIAHCDIAARDLLLPYGDLVIGLSALLRIKRTLDGAEIDKLIADFEARKALLWSTVAAPSGASASCPPAVLLQDMVTPVTRRRHMVLMIRWRDY